MELGDYIHYPPVDARLGQLDGFVEEESLASPIDMFRRTMLSVLQCGTEDALASSPVLGRSLALAIVSAAEGYFRAVISSCVELCPISQKCAADQSIGLGGLLWHGKQGYSRGALENSSLASKRELTKASKNFLGFDLNDDVFKVPLDQFDTVCHLRHGLVHADGILPGKNAVAINMPRYSNAVRIRIGYRQLQEIASVTNTLVLTFNRNLFIEMCQRWAVKWRQRVDWDAENEQNSFKKIWIIFLSEDQRQIRRGRKSITWKNCMNDVKLLYSIP